MIREFVVMGDPQGKARARVANGHAYTPKKTVEYEREVKLAYLTKYRDAPRYEKGVPVAVTIYAYLRIPASCIKSKQDKMRRGEIRPTKVPDTDNIAKCCMDALNGLAWDDDSQVVKLHVFKLYNGNPLVRVMMDEITKEEELCSGGY